MKKSTKISLLVSLILVIAGAVCIFISLLGAGFDMRKFSNMTFEKKVFEITENFDGLHINEENDNIELYLSDDKTCKIVCYDSDEVYHEYNFNDDGRLMIFYRDNRVWYEKCFTLMENKKIQIYLPDKEYKELAIHSVNSNIDVPNSFTFEQINIHTVNGKISLNCDVAKWRIFANDFQEKTGYSRLNCNVTEGVSVETTNGVILLTGEINGKIHADTVNGKIIADNIKNADSADFSTTNASIDINADVIKKLDVHSTNGSIQFSVKNSDRINMETVNGKITGTVPADKKCVARSTNGKISVPNRVDNDGDFYFQTVNGDVNINKK